MDDSENYIEEDERLHDEVSLNQLQLPPLFSGEECSLVEEEVIIKYETQAQLLKQERIQAMGLWQTAALELDHLQKCYQNELMLSHKHQLANQELHSTNCNLLKTVSQQSTEMEELHDQLRTTKDDLRTAKAKVDEMTQQLLFVQQQIKKQEGDVIEAQSREEAARRQIQQLQAAISKQEPRVNAASQEAENAQKEQTMWEKTSATLQKRCATLEEEKYEAVDKVRECVQMAEEATLQRDEAHLRAKQLVEELEKTRRTFQQVIQDAALCSQKEVTQIRELCNTEMQRMAEELSMLQLESAEKQSQIERFKRERRALEEELQKVIKGREEQELGQLNALHQRFLNAERMKEEMNITLQGTQSKLKKIETEYNEELSRSQEELQRLQGCLAAAQKDCVKISEERLQLQQENLQARREMDELQKTHVLIQTKTKQQMTQMDQDYSTKEKSLEAQMSDLENCSHESIADLIHLLTAQQKSIQCWKVEALHMVQAFETKIKHLMEQLNLQHQCSHELKIQLKNNNITIAEYETQLAEFQEKASRLQRRLTKVEQRASISSQQLSILASQKEKKSLDNAKK
ncbi:sodium channel and clathrin linker 1-like isoform X7 [Nerophis lumbriciformis]|uniref:sodium channel and clathrin linker 1-like isoform X7 n=1 Tax=Nerophis lumbriciformis TaxID=546530 RepID=UPI002ADF547B|nr:sodium channel and clathrin linker 1-like isoform X4 [Nerophis lumbriciformis]